MTPEQFVEEICRNSSDRQMKYYRTIVAGHDSVDPNWEVLRSVLNKLPDVDAERLWRVIQAVQEDAISGFFDILDNQAFPASQKLDLELRHGEEILNGDLTDLYAARRAAH